MAQADTKAAIARHKARLAAESPQDEAVRAAYEAGREAERKAQQGGGDDTPTLTRESLLAMSNEEINRNWEAVSDYLKESGR